MADVQAYAAWRTAQTGRLHRLPYEMEWEKAARGADQRPHVWGTDAIEPTWCRIFMSVPKGRASPAPIGSYPADESPYGVLGLTGNVSDLCADHYTRNGPIVAGGRWSPTTEPTGLHPVRGAGWNAHPRRALIGVRGGMSVSSRSSLCGFRLVMPVS